MTDKNTDAELTAKVAAMTPHGAAEATVGLYCLRFSDRVAVRARDCSESASKLFGVMQAYAIVESLPAPPPRNFESFIPVNHAAR
jgi:hypothetical protein